MVVVFVGVVAVCSTRVALLLPVKYLVRIGVCLLLPAGAHGFREAETTKCAYASVATPAGPGLPAVAGCSRRALESPALRGVRLPLPLGYTTVAAA